MEGTEALARSNDELAMTLSTLQRAQSDLVRSGKAGRTRFAGGGRRP